MLQQGYAGKAGCWRQRTNVDMVNELYRLAEDES